MNRSFIEAECTAIALEDSTIKMNPGINIDDWSALNITNCVFNQNKYLLLHSSNC